MNEIDYNSLWLPYTQMQTANKPLKAAKTLGSRIILEDGKELVDGIASWWTACHGYNHPYIIQKAQKQLEIMPHIMFGGIVHQPALELSKRLCNILPGDLNKVFFSDSGSVSVEVALKIAVQFWINHNKKQKNKILSFFGGYHGDTFATMAICDPIEGMHSLFKNVITKQPVLPLPVPAHSKADFEKFLEKNHNNLAAIIIEPLVQGAGGMIFHTPETLQYLNKQCKRYDLLFILDEIFTGFGRTGSFFACDQADIIPDIITLSKALTGGTMALAATVTNDLIYNAFLSTQYEMALMHGPTFMGNPLGCACANASLDVFEQYSWRSNVEQIQFQLEKELAPCRNLPLVKNVRVLGAIGVVELYKLNDLEQLKQEFIKANVWIRPFRTIIYLTPAFTISPKDLSLLTHTIYNVLKHWQ